MQNSLLLEFYGIHFYNIDDAAGLTHLTQIPPRKFCLFL